MRWWWPAWSSVAAEIAWPRKQMEVPDVDQQRDEEDGAAEQRVHGVLVVAEIQQHRVCVGVGVGVDCESKMLSRSRRRANVVDGLRGGERRRGNADAASSHRERQREAIPGPDARRDGASRGAELVRNAAFLVRPIPWMLIFPQFRDAPPGALERDPQRRYSGGAACKWIGGRREKEADGAQKRGAAVRAGKGSSDDAWWRKKVRVAPQNHRLDSCELLTYHAIID